MHRRHDERRGFVRVPFNTEVVITSGDWSLRTGTGIDISMSGLHLTGLDDTDAGRPVSGAPCRARIHLRGGGDQALIETAGRIIRSEPGELAVQFVDIELEGYQHLRQLILNNSDDPDRAEEQFDRHRGIRQT